MSKNTAAHNTHVLTSTLHVEKYNNKTNMCKNNLCIVKKVIIQESDIFPLVISQKRSSPFTWGFTWPALRSRKLWTSEITRKLTVTLSGVFHGGVALKSSSWSTSPYQTKETLPFQWNTSVSCNKNVTIIKSIVQEALQRGCEWVGDALELLCEEELGAIEIAS